jgi:hypothetical protein
VRLCPARRTGARRGWRAGAASLLVALAVSGHHSLLAQSTPLAVADTAGTEAAHGRHADAASPLLPPEHWAVRAAQRAEALGLADGWLAAQGAVPRGAALDALERAAAEAEAEGRPPRLAALAAGWLARFREEFPEYGEDAESDPLLVGVNGHASAGFAGERGRLSPAVGYLGTRQEPQSVPDVATARVDVGAAVHAGPHAAAFAVGRWDAAGADVARWEAVAQAGPVAISAGKQPVAYGWGDGGSVIFSSTLLPRVEARTVRPVRLPGVLRVFGGVTAHTFFSRVGGARHPDEPWLWGARLAFQPNRRLTFAVNRGSMFGGADEVTPDKLLRMFLGQIRGSSFENQLLSFEGRLRLPTEGTLPATLYLEWGADDGAGALDEAPGRVGGIFLPALPGLPEVAAGAEVAWFEVGDGEHGAWYFNTTFPGNWARGSRPLGHPLGGEGWEAAAYARAELMAVRLRVEARGFTRERGESTYAEISGGNLFSRARTGRSAGARGAVAYRLRPHAEVRAAGRAEAGDGWSESALDLALSVFF